MIVNSETSSKEILQEINLIERKTLSKLALKSLKIHKNIKEVQNIHQISIILN